MTNESFLKAAQKVSGDIDFDFIEQKHKVKELAIVQADRIMEELGKHIPIDEEVKKVMLAGMKECYISGAEFGYDEVVQLFIEAVINKEKGKGNTNVG